MEPLTFGSPQYLWLLIAIPLFVFIQIRSKKELNKGRAFFILITRTMLYSLLVLAVSEPALKKQNDGVTTYFIIDRSGSIPDDLQNWSLDVVKQATSKMRKNDRAGLILFGSNSFVEESPTPYFQVNQLLSVVDKSQTDIAAAIRLALATFPEDTQKRIVLFTDGNETLGNAAVAIQRAVASNCPVDIVPLRYNYKNEFLLESLTLPRKVQKSEPFQIRVIVSSLNAARAKLELFCDYQLIGSRDVQLIKGDNPFTFTHTLKEPGFHLFEASVSGSDDSIKENNRTQTYTIIDNEPLVLIASSTQDDVSYLSNALKEEGIPHRLSIASGLAQDMGEWQSFDAIVFANLGAENLSITQMQMIESLVKDLGAGFVMIGGEKSFGAGGYLNTPIAKILPVNLDVTQNQVLPNGGIVFMLDHVPCIGDRWSKDICVGTLNGITKFDEFGMLIPNLRWQVELQPATDKHKMIEVINSAHIGALRNVDRYIDETIKAFSKSKASYRHAVLVTPAHYSDIVPSDSAIKKLADAKITLSIVVIEYSNIRNVNALQEAAKKAGGNFYLIQPWQHDKVPKVYVKESQLIKKGLYFERPFTPIYQQKSEILEGISSSEIPVLLGYNVTSEKKPTEIPLVSENKDAVLAHWNYGLGKSVAFTSDATTRWGKNWVSWGKYKQFWSQLIRWCTRKIAPSPFHLTLSKGKEQAVCEAIIDAIDEKGNFVNFLAPLGRVVTPDFGTLPIEFKQIGPGRYKTTFPTSKHGGYSMNVQYELNGKRYQMRGGYVPPFQPEYQKLTSNEAMFLSITEATGGRLIELGMDFFKPTGEVTFALKPLWPLLVVLALCILPFDIFNRKVIIGIRDVLQSVKSLISRVIPSLRPKDDPVKQALELERKTITGRSQLSWEPKQLGLEGVSSEGAAPITEPKGSVSEKQQMEINLTKRLFEAKKRADKEMEK